MTYDKATSSLIDDDAGIANEWPEDDHVPQTVVAMLTVIFVEMWPVLRSSADKLTAMTGGRAGVPVPGKSFSASHSDQFSGGKLTHEFQIPIYDTMGTSGGETKYGSTPVKHLTGRRMVVPYQIWMLGRIADDVVRIKQDPHAKVSVASFLKQCGDPQGEGSFMNVGALVSPCRLDKIGGKLFTTGSSAKL